VINKLAKILLLCVLFGVSATVHADEPSSEASERGGPEEIFTPGLGEIMTLTQMRHIKLWLAGKAGNWRLAKYELYELQEGFDDAVKFHPDRARLLPGLTAGALEQLNAAISSKKVATFQKAFKTLTNACNACHQATDFGFNVVVVPTGNPYTNQRFEIRD